MSAHRTYYYVAAGCGPNGYSAQPNGNPCGPTGEGFPNGQIAPTALLLGLFICFGDAAYVTQAGEEREI